MESPQTVVLANSSVTSESAKPKPDVVVCSSNELSEESGFHENKTPVGNTEGFIGLLEVFIHQARDIHNICIYQKQDVYAKLCLTSDPEITVSTQIINGGGKNPVFNEKLQLNVRKIESSLKCEIWMLSRVRNYLEDQLLGVALVPLSDVLIRNGKLAQEFSLSSDDLFHSPAGFIQLTLSYSGFLPEVIEIPTMHSSLAASANGKDSDVASSIPSDLEKIEFLDPKIVNENEMMVSEYFGIPCADHDCQVFESLCAIETDNHPSSDDINVPILRSQSKGCVDGTEIPKFETLPSSDGRPEVPVPASSNSLCDSPRASQSTNQSEVSPPKKVMENIGKGQSESNSSIKPGVGTFVAPVISVDVEAEQKVMQHDIVDMYMKSMQQFTDSLAKMKLPMDVENGSAASGPEGSDEKVQASKGSGRSPRVFYGSRAFF